MSHSENFKNLTPNTRYALYQLLSGVIILTRDNQYLDWDEEIIALLIKNYIHEENASFNIDQLIEYLEQLKESNNG